MTGQYNPLPQTSEALEQLSWAEIEKWYHELASTSLTSDTLEPWLQQWSQLSALIDEVNTWLEISSTRNTADKALSQRRKRFLEEIFAPAQSSDQQIKQQLLASGLEPEGFALPLRKLRVDADLFREENIPLFTRERELIEAYRGINGAQKVIWDGEEVSVFSLSPVLEDPDRARREQAWRTFNGRKFEDREAINEVWQKSVRLRQEIARNAGYHDYRSYRWQQLYRFDYTPDDCKKMHDSIEQVIVPVAGQFAEQRRKRLGVETLRPWDISVNPYSDKAPRPITDSDANLRQCAAMFHQIDPDLGGYFDTMIKEQCFDLEERTNKAAGGYCLALEARQLPFIFGRALTISDILGLIFHEAGHAFHAFEMRPLYIHQRKESMHSIEFAEVASISMEFIGGMHMVSSGLCTEEEARDLRRQHLESTLIWLPRMMRGDAFQHWIYEHPEQAVDPEAVSDKWAELGRRFEPHLDWSGLEAIHRNDWQHTLHYFEVPFYYIEYAFATIGALQVWRNYLRDPQSAIQRYRQALALGATRSVLELYTAAGARFAFDPAILQDIVQLVMSEMPQ